jgi:hypothetical protein
LSRRPVSDGTEPHAPLCPSRVGGECSDACGVFNHNAAATDATYDAIDILLTARDAIRSGADLADVAAFNTLERAAAHLGAFDGQDDDDPRNDA